MTTCAHGVVVLIQVVEGVVATLGASQRTAIGNPQRILSPLLYWIRCYGQADARSCPLQTFYDSPFRIVNAEVAPTGFSFCDTRVWKRAKSSTFTGSCQVFPAKLVKNVAVGREHRVHSCRRPRDGTRI